MKLRVRRAEPSDPQPHLIVGYTCPACEGMMEMRPVVAPCATCGGKGFVVVPATIVDEKGDYVPIEMVE